MVASNRWSAMEKCYWIRHINAAYVEAIAGFIALGKTVAGGRVDMQPAAPCKLAPPKIGDDEWRAINVILS